MSKEIEQAFNGGLDKAIDKITREITENMTLLYLLIKKQVNISLVARCPDAEGYNISISHIAGSKFLTSAEFKMIKEKL